MINLPLKPKHLKLLLLLLATIVVVIILHQSSLTFSPKAEEEAMTQLAQTKDSTGLSPFSTDGCSGNVSANWTMVVSNLDDFSPTLADAYRDVEKVPFEAACVAHDRLYHLGEGGYTGRLLADMQLRRDIIEYALANTEDIKARTNISSDAEVIFLYQTIGETIYSAVRLGGAPCTGKNYAWGYGYGSGECTDL